MKLLIIIIIFCFVIYLKFLTKVIALKDSDMSGFEFESSSR